MVAYAEAADMLLGDVEVPTTVDLTVYLDRASRDINVALGTRYVVPITTATTPGSDVLRDVCADLAAAYYVMAVAQGGEDNHVNAYAMHLYDRAARTLQPYIDGTDLLTGAIKIDQPTNPNPSVQIAQEDSGSLLAGFYKYVGDPFQYPLPVQPPVVRPYK